jgi:hypothetical protein
MFVDTNKQLISKGGKRCLKKLGMEFPEARYLGTQWRELIREIRKSQTSSKKRMKRSSSWMKVT